MSVRVLWLWACRTWSLPIPHTPPSKNRVEFALPPVIRTPMPTAKRVLLVDDDKMLRTSLAEQLASEGAYSIVEAANCAEARALAKDGLYEFIVLDVGLPDG